MQGVQQREKEEEAIPPEPLTLADYKRVRTLLLPQDPIPALFLDLMWSCAARPKDIAMLRPWNINFQTPDTNGNVPTAVTIRETKGALRRGPYTIPALLTRDTASLLQQLMQGIGRHQLIFPDSIEHREKILHATKRVHPLASLASYRKGAIRHLAQMGVPETQLIRITGHSNLETLRRYLGYGLQLTAEDVTVQANAGRLHQEQNSQGPAHPAPVILA